ncbi:MULTISPECIES: DUF3037 domain-containing protein [unclassified Janibacter]|uniref:DUF3037 domain-containing protein n=1 Tax=unclassified Janibacter TaxID=2649294 RepID=UPI003D03DB60
MKRHAYQYVTLRCVPRVDREEFLNVGVVLYSQSADVLDACTALDPARLTAFAPELDVDGVTAALAIVADVCAGVEGGGRPVLGPLGRRFGWLSAPRSTILQPSPVHSGLTDDPRGELEALCRRLVG